MWKRIRGLGRFLSWSFLFSLVNFIAIILLWYYRPMVGIPWVQYKLDHMKVWMTLTQITLASVVVILIALGVFVFDRIKVLEDQRHGKLDFDTEKRVEEKGVGDESFHTK